MYNLYVQMKDSVVNEENKKTTYKKQFQIEYEIQATKDSIINVTKRKEEQLKHEQAINEQRMYTFGGLAGFLLMFLVAGVSYKAYKNKKKANLLLEQKNIEIYKQKEEILTQRDLVTLQKEQIEEIHKEVTDSINYAKRIQEAVLPVSVEARSILGEHFIIFKPKDIVSGDFYFTTKIQNWLIIAVADCTGHGVPGAFMSMLGISLLNEIVQNKEIHKASQVLNILRSEIINALQQKGLSGEQKDGMDISLFVINKETNDCQWAGANNPLYIVKSRKLKDESKNGESENHSDPKLDKLSTLNFVLDELKGDKMPIAIYPKMHEFTNHEFTLQKGDCVYLFTDGYADQFGGEKGKKFLYKKFKELLINTSSISMDAQKKKIEDELDFWMNGYGTHHEQVDDITVLGIKI